MENENGKDVSKLLAYRRDETLKVVWLVEMNDKSKDWKPDEELRQRDDWVGLSCLVTIPNANTLGFLPVHMVQYFDNAGHPGKQSMWENAPKEAGSGEVRRGSRQRKERMRLEPEMEEDEEIDEENKEKGKKKEKKTKKEVSSQKTEASQQRGKWGSKERR
eukprot:g67857.t1